MSDSDAIEALREEVLRAAEAHEAWRKARRTRTRRVVVPEQELIAARHSAESALHDAIKERDRVKA